MKLSGQNKWGLIFVLPFVIIFLLFTVYPIVNTVYLSFTDSTLMTREHEVVGWKNFEQMLDIHKVKKMQEKGELTFKEGFATIWDSSFMKAMKNTWVLWIWNFIPQIGIALMLSAWFTNQRLKIKGVGVWRAIYYMPNLLMPTTIAALFFTFFDFHGPVNQVLVPTFLAEAEHFMLKEHLVRGMVIFIQWWMWFGQTTILVMAGMTSISPSLFEAARVDGASGPQIFWRITLPLLRPIMVYIMVTSLVGGMQMFDIPFILGNGKGDPGKSILTNNVLMYIKFSSSKGHIGAASAVAMGIFLVTTFVGMLVFYLLKDNDND